MPSLNANVRVFSLTVPLAALAVLAALPGASAHGNPETRDIDTRVLIDANSLTILDYCAGNGLAEDLGENDPGIPPQAIPLCEGGHDLMDLDLREAYGPGQNGSLEPGVYARLIFRRGFVELNGAIRDEISFTANGTTKTLDLKTEDNQVFTSTTFTWVSEKSAAGTYESQVFAFAPYSVLGVGPGASMESIQVLSWAGDKRTDVMPGTYYFQDQAIPDEAQQPEADTGPARFDLKGPTPLFTVEVDEPMLDLTNATSATATVTLTANTTLGQNATFFLVAAHGPLEVRLPAADRLPGGDVPTTFEMVVDRSADGHHAASNTTQGHLMVQVVTDLGGMQMLHWMVELPAPEAHEEPHDEPHAEHEEKDSPGLAFAVILGALAGGVALRRR